MQRARTAIAKDKRREVLLESALDEFFDKGFKAARMDDIAARADLTKGTLYLYFASKEALFNALVDNIAIPNVEVIEKITAVQQTSCQAIEQFCHMAPSLLTHSKLPKMMKILISDAGVFPELVERYRQQVIDRVLDAMTKVLEKGAKSGELRVDNPSLTARLVVAPVVLSAIWQVVFARTTDNQVDLCELFLTHQDILFRALRTCQEYKP
ncbi:TetR/AcrR family transcriptional regulator [Neptunicella sp. SCSIO 80796]|uniref:TetR/AcrR family transcriptional regulator n=1 Tax=Neptunicella plasticusilytica TaxID=3117012 RepID=UPI003A4E1630